MRYLSLLLCLSVLAGCKTPSGQPGELFNHVDLTGWRASGFPGERPAFVHKDGYLVIPAGDALSGVTYTGDVPKKDYEVVIEAQRHNGGDFFCGLTFPVNDTHATLVMGGWGGTLVGISSINLEDARNNNTARQFIFENGRWYTIRLQVRSGKLAAWIDAEQVVDADIEGQIINIRPDIAEGKPFGIATYQTTAWVRSIRIRPLPPEAPAGR